MSKRKTTYDICELARSMGCNPSYFGDFYSWEYTKNWLVDVGVFESVNKINAMIKHDNINQPYGPSYELIYEHIVNHPLYEIYQI